MQTVPLTLTGRVCGPRQNWSLKNLQRSGKFFPGQFPWGDSTITNLDYTLINEGTLSEQLNLLDLSQGNAMYKAVNGVINGPVRCGALQPAARIANRKITGAAYYGVMEMEETFWKGSSLEFPEGRNYKGSR